MKRFFLLILSLWKQRLKLYCFAALIGALIGVILLYPIYDFIFVYENEGEIQNQLISALNYTFAQLKASFMGETPKKTLLLAEIGALFGVITAWGYEILHWRIQNIHQLSTELSSDIQTLIQEGEGSLLEFKSSFRWDLKQNCANRSLEAVILKTVAGFLNSSTGGTLLIGISDNGELLGLQHDYQSLKRQDQDGLEQAIVTAISTNLGADICQFVKVLFYVIEDKDICRLIILTSPRPVFLKQGKILRFYLRTGGGTRDLNIKEAVEFIIHRWSR